MDSELVVEKSRKAMDCLVATLVVVATTVVVDELHFHQFVNDSFENLVLMTELTVVAVAVVAPQLFFLQNRT
jgi:hypothetical protein